MQNKNKPPLGTLLSGKTLANAGHANGLNGNGGCAQATFGNAGCGNAAWGNASLASAGGHNAGLDKPGLAAEPAQLRQAQHGHWEQQLASRPRMFGAEASAPAQYLCALLQAREDAEQTPPPDPQSQPDQHDQSPPAPQPLASKGTLLELGAGQGRDTVYFAAAGWQVLALDYAAAGVQAVEAAARAAHLHAQVCAVQHDVRQPLPFTDASVDACYAHMLLCMALTTDELRALCAEVRRVLRPGGLFVYTVRHEGDPHHGVGVHGGENMYETGGFMVHFFNRAMVDTLAEGFRLREVQDFEEGALPRKLWRVTMEKAD